MAGRALSGFNDAMLQHHKSQNINRLVLISLEGLHRPTGSGLESLMPRQEHIEDAQVSRAMHAVESKLVGSERWLECLGVAVRFLLPPRIEKNVLNLNRAVTRFIYGPSSQNGELPTELVEGLTQNVRMVS